MAIIDKPSDYFNTVLYTGNATTNAITGVGFQPDLIWVKSRNNASNSNLIDSVRGVKKHVSSSSTNAEDTEGGSNGLSSFDSDGFTWSGVNTGTGTVNANSTTYVGWSWLGGGTAVSNTAGDITSSVSANTTSGFSIVSYTGTGANATVGHGLGVAPKMIIVKNREATENWLVYHQAMGNTSAMKFNLTSAIQTTVYYWNNTSPTSSTFSLGASSEANTNADGNIAYCFAEKKGYSKFGSYTGNGSTDGTFVYTGFKPAWVMVKKTNGATNWQLIDNKRSDAGGNNIIDKVLSPNATDADYDEGSVAWCGDLLSNGFKWRGNWGALNNSGDTYIYMAFAENPFVTSTGVPATAR